MSDCFQVESKIIDASENVEIQTCSKISEPPIVSETKSNVADSTESPRVNCESCDKNRNTSIETRPQITVKSFDMPNIDCDDQEQVAIKQEADDSYYEVCYDSSQCEPTSTSERSRSSCEKSSQEATKRHSVEKTHHPGIENVVEKLKKNAAALQEAALPNAQKFEESMERSNVEIVKPRRYSETIPKKLHLLRSCQNSLESSTIDTEISSSQTAMSEQYIKDQSGRHSPQNDRHLTASDMSGECLLNENNNDSRSNNNNIKALENKKLLAKNEKNVSHDITAYVKPKTVWRCEVQPFGKPNVIRKSNIEDTPSETKSRVQKQKPAIDVSGLELLSNSIEQLERVGQPEHLQLDVDVEKSPVKTKLISQQSENNNNNVGSPLGLLCALAEQIMEVGDKIPRKLNLESSEEISQAGRLLLNLGRSGSLEKDENKRKYIETDNHRSKRFKINDEEGAENAPLNYHEKDIEERTMEVNERKQENALKLKESSKNIDNFSEEEIDKITDEKTVDSEKQSLSRTNEDYYSNTKTVKKLQFFSDKTTNNLQNNDALYDKIAKEDNLSDSESEMFESKALSEQSTSCEIRNNKHKISVEERDTHDYKNARTKLEAKKFIARKGNRDNEDDWPSMNATELDMRVRMADIQRQYREKQKELSKLIPKKDDKKNSGRPRKKSHSSTR